MGIFGNVETPEAPAPSTPSPDDSGGRLPRSFQDLARKRRGVKPGTRRGSYKKDGAPAPAPESMEAPSPCFTPESVRPLVSLPFNLAFVKTGFEGFCLSEGEAATLSGTGAMVFNQWVAVDPKWLALITFSLTLASISVEKTMLYRKALVEFAAEQERKKNAAAAEVKA